MLVAFPPPNLSYKDELHTHPPSSYPGTCQLAQLHAILRALFTSWETANSAFNHKRPCVGKWVRTHPLLYLNVILGDTEHWFNTLALPCLSRPSVHLSLNDNVQDTTAKPTYCSQDQVSSSSSSIPQVFELPSIPLLTIPQNEGAEVSCPISSHRVDQGVTSSQPPLLSPLSLEAPAVEYASLMSQPATITQEERTSMRRTYRTAHTFVLLSLPLTRWMYPSTRPVHF